MKDIVDALQQVGFPVPEGCRSIRLDSETDPTRIVFTCHMHRDLTVAEAQLVVKAVQVHKVSHRLRGKQP